MFEIRFKIVRGLSKCLFNLSPLIMCLQRQDISWRLHYMKIALHKTAAHLKWENLKKTVLRLEICERESIVFAPTLNPMAIYLCLCTCLMLLCTEAQVQVHTQMSHKHIMLNWTFTHTLQLLLNNQCWVGSLEILQTVGSCVRPSFKSRDSNWRLKQLYLLRFNLCSRFSR